MSTMFSINNIEDGEELLQKLNECTTECKEAEELFLRGVNLNEKVSDSLMSALGSRVWKSVEISDCQGDCNSAVSHVLRQDCVTSLTITGDDINTCCQHLTENQNLIDLRVTTTWTESSMQSISNGIEKNRNLTTLDFRWSTFEGNAIQVLAKGLRKNTGLKNLRFSGCGLEDDHVRNIVAALQYHPTLECLDFNGNKCKLLPVPPKSSCLKSIDLRRQKTSEKRRLEISALAEGLRSNTSLRCVKLAENNLNDDDAGELAKALSENTSLEELHLARNKITDVGIIKLAALFPKMKNLRKLTLWGNPFGEAGAKALLEGLKHNVVLEDLELFQNFSMSAEILHHTWTNRAGKRIFQADPNEVPLALWPKIFERIDNMPCQKRHEAEAKADALFYMLRGPALFDTR